MKLSQPIDSPGAYEAVFGRRPKPTITVTIVCQVCGETAQVKRAGKLYCSDKCRSEAHDSLKDPRLSRLNTVAQIADILQVSTTTVRSLVKSGQLTAHRVGRTILIVRPLGTRVAPSVTMPSAIAASLRIFTESRHLSLRDLAHICNISKTTAQRLVSGTLLMQSFEKRRDAIADHLTAFLTARGERDPDSVIKDLFKH